MRLTVAVRSSGADHAVHALPGWRGWLGLGVAWAQSWSMARPLACALACTLTLGGLSAAPSANAGGLEALAQFLQQTRSGRADFTQVVTPPPKDGQARRGKTSTGQFAFLRPARFRFDYLKPFAQVIVADGQTLWLYDPDLEQVTARKQAQALNNTPAALVATASELSALERDFQLQELADAEGLQWVQATPKQRDGTLQSVRIGLKPEGTTVSLVRLDILDQFGQRSQISFGRFEANPSGLSAAQFQFTPPRGVDVVRP
jgi:outer membrane lipoprotein carrier protein